MCMEAGTRVSGYESGCLDGKDVDDAIKNLLIVDGDGIRGGCWH